MFTQIKSVFEKILSFLIRINKDNENFVSSTRALFISFTATDIVMWLYVVYCYKAFNGFHPVTTGGLIFTILHTFTPVVFYYTQSLVYSSLTLSLTGLGFQTLFCLYTGGIYSPAAIWLTLHPVILGFFGTTNLTYFAVAINSTIILGMYITEHFSLLPVEVIPETLKNLMTISSFIGLDVLVAVFTIAAVWAFKKQNNELKRSQELSESLIRVLAHDINNPLTILRYYHPNIINNPNSFTPTVAERINKASEDIERITESVSMWIAHRDGKLPLKNERLQIPDLVKHLELSFEDKLKNKKLKIQFILKHEGKDFAGDKTAVFYQVFNNLISNAIKFSFEESQIDFIVQLRGNQMEFTVRDYGIGIPDDLCDKVFSPFYQTTRSGTKNEKGTGFGLPIVATIIEKLDGDIRIQNVNKILPNEKGTMIIVNLPVVV